MNYERDVLGNVTEVRDGDAFFPEVDFGEWTERGRERVEADERNDHAFDIVQYDRAAPR